jgi:glutathione-regulated potassium-efflux system ancillary protein KefG
LLEKSRVHLELIREARKVPGVRVHDLYELYPEFDIDVSKEKQLLLSHDIIIWQHPLYWYSAPALLKQWQDLVLEHGWAYGKKGLALAGKKVFNVVTSGGSQEAYQPGGFNKYAIEEYLRPFERTAELCHMVYWPPYWISGVHRLEREGIRQHAGHYRQLLEGLVTGKFGADDIAGQKLLNHLPTPSTLHS